MPDTSAIVTDDTEATADDTDVVEAELIESDLLVEDVSIDGMCGVY